jgi:hypothetical protein
MSNYQHENAHKNKSPGGKRSHFSAKAARFSDGFFQAKEGPGPGDYDHDLKSEPEEDPRIILTKAQREGKGKGGAVFKSTTDRFIENDAKNPCIRILDKKHNSQNNDLGIYNMKAYNSGPQYQGMIQPTRKVGFTATSPRFTHNQIFYGQKLKYTPGPGDYHSLSSRPKTYSHNRAGGRKQAFGSYVENKGTNMSVGPGSYNVDTD